MKNVIRGIARGAATIIAAVSALAVPGVAHADGPIPEPYIAGCPDSGYPVPGNPSQSCTSMTNGALFHGKHHPDSTRTRIYSQYKKTSGSAITARLGYNYAGTNHWGDWFTQSAGTTKTKDWYTYDYDFWCNNTVGLLNVSGQGTFQTPISRCA
ncbi:hypothetical protein [Streptomyces sp. NRRL S-87]|uniref:hypothetical protein n=1 Tax=Streptomyces sp. NRRL S-87 TaxID=1463920 RepID=UPI0004C24631|nr:hypothetical protein [Streptomyces sp. NRRL S-87]